MIDIKWGVIRFYICFYFVVYVQQLNALLILFSFKIDRPPAPPPFKKKRASKIYEIVAIQSSFVIK